MDDETAVIDGLRRRDPAVFAQFFAAHVERVYRLAAGIVGEDDAEDVVQATFLAAMEHISGFEPRARLSTWLYTIAYHQALGLVRRRHPTTALPDEDDGPFMPAALVDWSDLPEQQLLGAEARAALRAAIAGLPVGLRAAFVLRDVEQLSTADCAHVQGITETACKVRLHRARLALRERLSDYFGEWAREAKS